MRPTYTRRSLDVLADAEDETEDEANDDDDASSELDGREDRGIERVLHSAPLARRDAAALFQLARRVKAARAGRIRGEVSRRRRRRLRAKTRGRGEERGEAAADVETREGVPVASERASRRQIAKSASARRADGADGGRAEAASSKR